MKPHEYSYGIKGIRLFYKQEFMVQVRVRVPRTISLKVERDASNVSVSVQFRHSAPCLYSIKVKHTAVNRWDVGSSPAGGAKNSIIDLILF